MNESLIAEAIAGFHAAAVDELPWMTAVERLATATGSRSGELIGLGEKCVVPFNLMSGADPEAGAAFVAAGGGDPAINSRVRVGARSRELELCDEADFTTAADMRLNPEYGHWVRTYDMTQVCLTTLVKAEGLIVGMAIMRGERDDTIDEEAKRVFAAVAPHARRAVTTRIALEAVALQGLVGGLEATRAVAFVCAADGRVRAMTAAAEALIAEGRFLTLRGLRLCAVSDMGQPALDRLLADACLGGHGPRYPLALRSASGDDVRLAEASPLPLAHPLSRGPSALLLVQRPPEDVARIGVAAQACYGLSDAEAAVAASLALGRTAGDIARDRQVALGTVRSQVRAVFAKTGVDSQIKLAARLTHFG